MRGADSIHRKCCEWKTTDFSMWEKKFRTTVFTYQSSPLPAGAPLLCLNPLVANICKVYARKLDKKTAISPHRWRNHCLRSNVYRRTHRNRRRDERSYSSSFQARPRICELSAMWMWSAFARRKHRLDKNRNRTYGDLDCEFFCVSQFANFRVENKSDMRKKMLSID